MTAFSTPVRLSAVLTLLIASIALSLIWGTAGLSANDALNALLGGGDTTARAIVFEVRLPRVLAAVGVGSALAMSGVLLQALFRNPLADPYVLGVSGGAAVGALTTLLFGAGVMGMRGGALTGGLIAVAAVWVLGKGGGSTRLLLTGVVIASACGAIVAVLLSLADTSQLRGMVFWLAGDLSWSDDPRTSSIATIIALVIAIVLARPLNVLASGELRARTVGLDLGAWRAAIFVACAALTSTAVVTAGTVGFVGLITPHLVRLAFRTSDHRVVAPAAAALGGALVVCADLVARTAAAPRQFPVGAVIALVGAPLFLILLRERSPR